MAALFPFNAAAKAILDIRQEVVAVQELVGLEVVLHDAYLSKLKLSKNYSISNASSSLNPLSSLLLLRPRPWQILSFVGSGHFPKRCFAD